MYIGQVKVWRMIPRPIRDLIVYSGVFGFAACSPDCTLIDFKYQIGIVEGLLTGV